MSTVNEFIQELEGLGQELTNITPTLQEIGESMVQQMKQDVPVDKGNLRGSIRYVVNGTKLEVDMLEYGYYQNYGVFPNYNGATYHKPFMNRFGGIKQPIANPFGIPSPGYRNRKFGLPQRQFFDAALLQNELIEEIGNIIDNL